LADPSKSTFDIPIDAIVVVQTPDNSAYCKRFSGMKDGSLFLTSVNQGVGSVIVDAEGCRVMQVVGVLF
jgi:phage repressor protein C with HTH and peptisase S24 domain